MEEIDFFEGGEGRDFTIFFKNFIWPNFLITFLSAIQVLVWYKNLLYFFAENHRLEAPLCRWSSSENYLNQVINYGNRDKLIMDEYYTTTEIAAIHVWNMSCYMVWRWKKLCSQFFFSLLILIIIVRFELSGNCSKFL